MSRKLTFEEAAKIMRAAKLEPIAEYPGNKLPWKCKCLNCGLEVSPSLASVRTNGGGCRPCGLKKSAESRSTSEDLAIEIMKSAGVLPLDRYKNGNSPWRSKCLTCGKEVQPTLGNIKQGHASCVYCSKKKTHPDDAILKMKSVGLTPLEPYPGSMFRWKCRHTKCGEVVYPMLNSVVQGQGGCLKCGYKETQRKQLRDSEEAIKFFRSKGFEPLEEYPGSARPWRSKCLKCGFIVSPYFGRVKDGTGCGVCSKRIVVPEEATKVMINAKLKPLEPFPGSKNPWRCECLRCGEVVTPVYGNVNQGDGGCKYCGGHYASPDAAEKLMVLNNAIPLEPYVNSGVPWHCRCTKCNRDIYPTYNSVQQRGGACSYCSKRKIDAKDAYQIMVKAGATPLSKFPGATKQWDCQCNNCKRLISPRYTTVANIGANPCLYCAGKKVDADSAFKLMLAAELTPLVPYTRADFKWECECQKCGKYVTPTYTSIRVGQGGCRYCAEKGLDYNEPTFLYLMTHELFNAHKIGIGNHKTKLNRIDEHRKNGWVLIESKDFQSGDEAYEVEQAVMKWLRIEKKLPPYLSLLEMPQRGWTETVEASEVDLPTIWAKVEAISKVAK
jgi:recombinational DNA repair protein (RecF pathway)